METRRRDKKGRLLRNGEYQRPDGKYEYKYWFAGQRRTIYSWKLVATDSVPRGKKEDMSLREKEREIDKDLNDGIDTAKALKITLNELFTMYLDTKGKLKDKTKSHYIKLWRLNLKDSSLGKMKVVDIRKVHIQKFYKSLNEHGYADATIRIYHNNLLMPTLTFAVDNDLIRKNPAKGCSEGYNGTVEREALTIIDQNRFLKYVEDSTSYYVYFPMFQIMIGTACRIGEICGLTWADVDMKNRKVCIDHQLDYRNIGLEKKYAISPPKTERGIRTIPMTERVYEAFREQQRLNLLLGKKKDYEVDGYSDFVFLNGNNLPFTVSLVNAVLYRIVRQHNKENPHVPLPHISNHILRHTGCTRMAEAGVDTKVLQTIMGHSDIKVTMKVYNHVDNVRMEKEMKKVENIL